MNTPEQAPASLDEEKKPVSVEWQVTLDQQVSRLSSSKDRWALLPLSEKIVTLKQMCGRTDAVAESWVVAAAQAKGLPPASPLVGEEWTSGPWALLSTLKQLIAHLHEIDRYGTPQLKPHAVHTRKNGQVVVEVFPQSLSDRLLLSGVSAEVWMQPGVNASTLSDTMATWYKQSEPTGKVALILGAGNIASIAPLDVLSKLYTEGQVCLLKLNPVSDYLEPFLSEIFAPLIADGFVAIVSGGAEVGAYLCSHEAIDEIHITGSAQTHDAIVFGTGSVGSERKRQNSPLLTKHVTSELGNVSPTIVVPGPWSAADLRFQAEHIATQKLHNDGFNCIAAQVLILPEHWSQTPVLQQTLRTVMQGTPPRPAYYPGARQRQQTFVATHPEAEMLAVAGEDVPPTIIGNLNPLQQDESCFTTEAFGPVLAETLLPGESAAEYLKSAVAFCNDRLWGTLGANIIIHPTTIKELGPALEEAIAELRYGTIGINAWTAVGFLLTQASWGAYPGHLLNDIQSGRGVVHNTFMFDKPEKSVVRAPFAPFPRSLRQGSLTILPRPPWFVTNRQAHRIGRKLVQFESKPGVLKLLSIFADALRG